MKEPQPPRHTPPPDNRVGPFAIPKAPPADWFRPPPVAKSQREWAARVKGKEIK
jgi:hypothetical protein